MGWSLESHKGGKDKYLPSTRYESEKSLSRLIVNDRM